MTTIKKHFTPTHFPKFNSTLIKLNSNKIILTKKSHVKEIFLVTDYVVDFTGLKGRIKKKSLFKK